ncbi:hypothetical protein ACTXT7_016497 [Hymenolepis weldensis]
MHPPDSASVMQSHSPMDLSTLDSWKRASSGDSPSTKHSKFTYGLPSDITVMLFTTTLPGQLTTAKVLSRKLNVGHKCTWQDPRFS